MKEGPVMKDQERELHQKNLADHFSRLSSYWKDIYTAPVKAHDFYHQEAVKKRKQAVLDFVDEFAGGRKLQILDAGCGAGMIMEPLLQRRHQVVGVDITTEMIEETASMIGKYGQDPKAVGIGSVEDLDFPDQSFDLCICIGVLQYLKDDALALRELARVTRPGGRIIISFPNIARVTNFFDPYYLFIRGPHFILRKLFKFKKRGGTSASVDISRNLSFRNRRYHYHQLNGLYKQCGLAVHGISPIGYGPLTFWRREYLSQSFTLRVSGRIERIARYKPFSFLKLIADRWVVALQKT